MAAITKLINLYFARRLREIDEFRRNPAAVQERQFRYLIGQGVRTEFGRDLAMDRITTQEQFRRRIPIYDYETIREFIDRTRRGERNVLWPEEAKWFAKSSGTTDAKSKFIPVTMAGMRHSHMRGPKDIMALYCNLYPETNVVNGKMLTLGGSKKIEREGDTMLSGDLSAILIENTPAIANILRIPDKKTALIPDFDEKVRIISQQSTGRDVRSFTGVPSWNLVMLNRVLEYTGKDNILDIWPHMELFVHGGMDFRPYEAEYRKIIPSPEMRYMETYNASEGFFAIAEEPGRPDMLLMLDYGTYYEFLPTDKLGEPEAAVPLEGVRTGVNYAMIITNCNGLWRYTIGDTVQFVSTDPYRIKITGRTKHYINAFGEEVVIDNAESAMQDACTATGAQVAEYTAAPVYMEGRSKGAHEWIVEFRRPPDDMDAFVLALDRGLQKVNSDYEAKRYKDTTLSLPKITTVPPGTFEGWLRAQGKVGGQNKVPRLYNDRTYLGELLKFTRSANNPAPKA